MNVPATIIAGEDDKVVDPGKQSQKLHEELRDSSCASSPAWAIWPITPSSTRSLLQSTSRRVASRRSRGHPLPTLSRNIGGDSGKGDGASSPYGST